MSELSIEGFRGVNAKTSFQFDNGLTLFVGDNGTGKTSVLQAIEWCLTGMLPYLSGPDFSKEDAIVNMFHSKKSASVELLLADANSKMIAARTRKMTKSSRPLSTLTLKIGSKTLLDEDAEGAIEKAIEVPARDFSKVVYLHQESIKELLSIDPKERSRSIDRLLGTYELREFAEALDVKRLITAKSKELQERIDTLNRDKIQFAVNMRKRLSDKRTELVEADYKQSELTVIAATKDLSSVIKNVGKLAEKYNTKEPKITEPSPKLQSIGECIKEIEPAIKELDRQRLKVHGELGKRKQLVRSLKQDYEEARDEVDAFEQVTLQSIENQKERELKNAARDLSSIIKELAELAASYSFDEPDIKEPSLEMESVLQTVDRVDSYIKELDRHRLKLIGDLGKRKQALETLNSGYEEAEADVDAFGSTTLESIEKEKDGIEAELQKIEPEISRIEHLPSDLLTFKTRISTIKENIHTLESKIRKIVNKYGSEDELEKLTKQNPKEIESIKQRLESLSKLGQLVALGIDHISSTHPDKCPVCEQRIDSKQVVRLLEGKVRKDVAEEAERLRGKQKKLEDDLREANENLEELKKLAPSLESEKKSLEKALKELSELVGEKADEDYDFEKKIKSVKQELTQLNGKKTSFEKDLVKLDGQYNALQNAIKALEKAEGKLQEGLGSKATGKALVSAAEKEIESIGESTEQYKDVKKIDGIKEQNDKVRSYKSTIEELDRKYKALQKALKQLDEAEKELQKQLDSDAAGKALLTAAEKELEKIGESMKEYEDATPIDAVTGRLSKAEKVFDYLKDEEEVAKLEKELPQINKLIQSLEAAKHSLTRLEGSLSALREAALQYEKEAVTSELKALGDTINVYYSEIIAHPVFTKIRVTIEKEQPLIYSIQAAGSPGSTYISTRFSNAQMNAVAIAFFLANNEKLGGSFGTILMDDPTQSMDTAHKEALAKIISRLAETKQVVVSTQDGEFQDFLSKHCKPMKVYQFTKWSTNGPSLKGA